MSNPIRPICYPWNGEKSPGELPEPMFLIEMLGIGDGFFSLLGMFFWGTARGFVMAFDGTTLLLVGCWAAAYVPSRHCLRCYEEW